MSYGGYARNSLPPHGIFASYSGAEIVPVIDMPGRLQNPIVIGNIHTITYSTHSEIIQMRKLGSRRVGGFARGPRTVAGTLIFTVFERDIVRQLAPEYMDGILLDEMPPFNINVICRNDGGRISRYAILGVRLVDSGMVMSIDDIITENTVSYIAEDIVPLLHVRDFTGSVNVIREHDVASRSDETTQIDLTGKHVAIANELKQSEVGPALWSDVISNTVIVEESKPEVKSGVVILPPSGQVSMPVVPECSFYVRLNVKKLVMHVGPDGLTQVVRESVPSHIVRVYEGEHADWTSTVGPVGVDETMQVLSAATNHEGMVEFYIDNVTDTTTMPITVVVQWYERYFIRSFVLNSGERFSYTVELPIATTVGGSPEQAWQTGTMPPSDLPANYVPPKYVWIHNDDGSMTYVAVTDSSISPFWPCYGKEYLVRVSARCFYATEDDNGEIVHVPIDGEQLQASLLLMVTRDDKTPYCFGYPVPISQDGTAIADLYVVGYLRCVELEYVPVGHVHTLWDYAKPGYYFKAFHVPCYLEPRDMYGTHNEPAVLELGDIVFNGVVPARDEHSVHIMGVAEMTGGGCPPGAEVGVQFRWGDTSNDKCFASTTIPIDGVWYLAITVPARIAQIKRVYIEYKAPPGFKARSPYLVDGLGMIPSDTQPESPFNVMSLLSGYDNANVVFSPVLPDEYADGVPASEECSVPATVQIGGFIYSGADRQAVPVAVVGVSFMAMTPAVNGKQEMRMFSRYAVTDAMTGRFQLMIPEGKQICAINVCAAGYLPYNVQWPYIEPSRKVATYTPNEAELIEERRRAVAKLKSGIYEVVLMPA
ncbi:MAG TPA: hypothetical protein GX530_10265 [Corynebacteriales bacterium]|nr:hypothetical protein [Mycobacteriales bacterium]